MAMMISKFHKLVSSKKVWAAFAVLISVAFVIAYTGGKSGKQKSRSDAAKEVVGKVYGEKVSRIEFVHAYQNTHLLLTLQTQQPIRITPQVDQLIRQNAWQRIATLKKAKQMGLVVTEEQVANGIRMQPIFRNQQTGAFDRRIYDMFFAQILPKLGFRISPKDFENMTRENLLIDKATSTAMQGALVTQDEVDHAFHVYADKLTVQYASIPKSMAPVPQLSEEDAKNYYDTHPVQFTYPDKVKVRYVEFAVADYTNTVDVTDEMISSVYQENKQQFVVPGTEENAVPEYQPLEEVKDDLVAEITSALARRKAVTDAGTFVSKLSAQTTTFDELAAEAAKSISTTPPFAQNDTVRGVDPTTPFARTAFSLKQDKNHYYSDPVVGKDSVYVLVLQGKMPSFLPDYEVVASDAMAAAKEAAAQKAYNQKADAIHAEIKAALKAGTPFSSAAEQAGLKIETTEPFSVEEAPSDELGLSILRATVLFDANTLVDLIPSKDGFILAYVAEKEEADRSAADPALITQLELNVRRDKANRLAESWRNAVMEEAQIEDNLDGNS